MARSAARCTLEPILEIDIVKFVYYLKASIGSYDLQSSRLRQHERPAPSAAMMSPDT